LERILPDRIYLDHAATTPMIAAARDAVAHGMAHWANPSSPHAEGRSARAALEAARRAIASAYGWRGETLLTSGASESLAIALGRTTMPRRVITAVDHDAVLRAAGDAAVAPVSRAGIIDLAALATLLAGRPALVCVQWANSETGVRQPIAAVAEVVHAAGAWLLVDAAQMPASPELAEVADLIALSAHKRGGPPGVGALLVRDLAMLQPSGGQERGYRPGTENLPGAMGYAAALAEAEPDHALLRAKLDDAILRSGGEVVGADSPRHPAIGSYRLRGSACSSGSMKPSHVLAAMGWDEAAGREVIRVSFGRATTDAEVDAFIAAWRQMARTSRRLA